MALTYGRDHAGDFAAVECDRHRCWAHRTARPLSGQTGYDLLCATMDGAVAAGWQLEGSAYCPLHHRTRRRERLSDGFPWVKVHS